MSVFDALTDPTTDALMGLAQGFGAAAMPTRMPTPIGAVLGQGIGGLQHGLATGQVLRHSDIQNQQAQIGLDWYKNMTNPQGGGGGAPFGAPAMTQDSNGRYVVSPQVLSSLVPMLAAQGKDPTGPLKLLESYATSGVALDKSGNVFPIPGANQASLARKYAEAYGTTLGEAPGKPPVTFAVPVLDQSGRPTFDKDGMPITRPQTMTVGEAHSFLSGQPGGQPSGQPANASAADPFPAWAHQINHGENGTGNPAATNASGPGGTATSTAMGNGQFLAGTWPSVIRSVRPDLAAGKTDEQLLPLRAVPELAQSATEQYARQNAATLANAGLPVNGGTVALAHFLGPQGAQTVLNAKSDAPLSMLPGMGATVAANPSLKGMTAGQLVQKYQTQMGGVPQQTAQVAGPGAPTGANAPVQIPPATPQSAPMPAAPGVGGPQPLTPQQAAQVEIDKARRMPTKLSGGENLVLDPETAAAGPPQITLPPNSAPLPGAAHAGAPDTNLAIPGVPGGAIEASYGPRGEIEPRQKILTELENTSNGAQKELAQAQLLKQKMHELGSTGPATPFLANLSRYAEQAGVSAETLKKYHLPPGASETEAAALANSLMMEVAKEEFPGRVTNTDLKVASTVKPNPAMPTAAADYLIDNTVVPKAQRDIDRYRSVVPLTMPKLPDGSPNPLYDRELRGLYGTLNDFDIKKPLSSYSPALQLPTPPAAAIDHLKKNPALAAQFDAKFGPGASSQYLAGH